MKTKILNRVLAIVLLLALPVCIFGQMAVNDPLLNATLSLFKADAKLAQTEASVKMAESIAKTAQILQNVKMMVIKVDSFNSEVVDPLRNDYRFVKGLTENARWSDLWEAGEYVLGTSLNPADYMPSALRDPYVSKYLDKNLGWSYQNVDDWIDESGYNKSPSSYSRKLYRHLLPSREDIDLNYFLSENEMPTPPNLAFIDALLGEDTDSLMLLGLLANIDSYRAIISQQESEVKDLIDEIEKRQEQGQLSIEGYAAIRKVLNDTASELRKNKKELSRLTKELDELMTDNAQDLANQIANERLIRGLETSGKEVREYNNSRNAEMVDILFGK